MMMFGSPQGANLSELAAANERRGARNATLAHSALWSDPADRQSENETKQFNLTADFSAECIWCHFSELRNELRWKMNKHGRAPAISHLSTNSPDRPMSLLLSHPSRIQFYRNSNVITNAIRDASILVCCESCSHKILLCVEKCLWNCDFYYLGKY